MMKQVLIFLASAALLACNQTIEKQNQEVTCITSPPPSWNNGVSTLFQNYCVGCHSAFSDYSMAALIGSTIVREVSSGNMPKGGALSEDERNTIVQWGACGAPEN